MGEIRGQVRAGISLSKMMNTDLVIITGVGGTTLLVLMTFLLGRVIRRYQLHLSKEGF